MQHLHSLTEAKPDKPTCLTIGGFDGIHRGHQRVVRKMVETAREKGYRPAALGFFPLPKQVLGKPQPHYYLTSPEERARLFHILGVELVITHPFDEHVGATCAEDFVDLLVKFLDVKEIWVGPDFALGYKRQGNVSFLRAQGEKKGFLVNTVNFFRISDNDRDESKGTIVSSTLIRKAVKDGRMQDARRMLGRPYRIPGCIVKGDGRGSKIGFPTANIGVWQDQALPARGVYAGVARLAGGCFKAAINIGVRPTVTAGEEMTVEAHLLDFSSDVYGQEITLDFLYRTRDEKKFSSLENLVARLEQDVVDTRRLISEQDCTDA
ncbi:MAG: bifunctional riboflavin kinase/FAD synthetase [Anaerolineales bacterium]|nr:bifunctional riboflavin kinase/FAD synthetase [Anaerolineales bacterium]